MDANCDFFFFFAVWAKGSWLCFNTSAKQKENIKVHVKLLSGFLDCLLFSLYQKRVVIFPPMISVHNGFPHGCWFQVNFTMDP